MAEKSSSKVICENTENISEKQEKQQNHPNPLISLFQNFRIFFPSKPQQETKEVDAAAVVVSQEVEDGSTSLKKNPDVVRFSDARPIVPPPMKLESEEYEQITSPAVMWQVYALGGFIVLKWIMARWNERRAKKEQSDEETSPDDD